MDFKEYKLDNGFTLYVYDMPYSSVVYLDWIIPFGGRTTPTDKDQALHILEHVNSSPFLKLVKTGAIVNASTNQRYHHYYCYSVDR